MFLLHLFSFLLFSSLNGATTYSITTVSITTFSITMKRRHSACNDYLMPKLETLFWILFMMTVTIESTMLSVVIHSVIMVFVVAFFEELGVWSTDLKKMSFFMSIWSEYNLIRILCRRWYMDLSLTHPDRRHLTDDWLLIHNHFSNFHFLFSNGRYENVSYLEFGFFSIKTVITLMRIGRLVRSTTVVILKPNQLRRTPKVYTSIFQLRCQVIFYRYKLLKLFKVYSS